MKLIIYQFLFLQNVEGEVYNVDDRMMNYLDEFEGHPHFYRRETVAVDMKTDQRDKLLDSPFINHCGVYFLPKFIPELLDLKFIDTYKSTCKDQPSFVARDSRNKGPAKNLVVPLV